jgi:hypothetical protein
MPGPASRSPVNHKRITLQIILFASNYTFKPASQASRLVSSTYFDLLKKKKKVFRFEETPLILDGRTEEQKDTWGLRIRD